MTPARQAALWARVMAHELACMALHAVARLWGEHPVGRELRALADQHGRRADFLRAMLRREAE